MKTLLLCISTISIALLIYLWFFHIPGIEVDHGQQIDSISERQAIITEKSFLLQIENDSLKAGAILSDKRESDHIKKINNLTAKANERDNDISRLPANSSVWARFHTTDL